MLTIILGIYVYYCDDNRLRQIELNLIKLMF